MKAMGPIRRLLVFCCAAPLLAACATATGPSLKQQFGGLPEPPAGMGRLYVYRTAVPWMVALEPEVIVNGQSVGVARYDRFFFRDARPGRYEVFLTSDPDEPVYFTLAPGEARFVKAVVRWTITGTKLTGALIDETEGRREVESLKTVEDGGAED